MDELIVVKRSGQRVNFNGAKIAIAIKHAFDNVYDEYQEIKVNKVYNDVLEYIKREYQNRKTINVEDVQDIIEKTLKKHKYDDVYLAFNEYRLRRAASREVFSAKQQHKFVKAIETVGLTVKGSKEVKPIDLMMQFGKTVSKEFANAYLLENKYVRAQEEGIIHIHNIDNYALGTMQSLQIDLSNIKSNSLSEYIDNIIEIVSNLKEELYGEHLISNLDELLNQVIDNEFKQIYTKNIERYFKVEGFLEYINFEELSNEIQIIDLNKFEISKLDKYLLNKSIKDKFIIIYEESKKDLENILYIKLKRLLISIDKLHFKNNSNVVTISILNSDSFVNKILVMLLNELDYIRNLKIIYKIRDKLELSDGLVNKQNIAFSKGEVFFTGEEITGMGNLILSTTTINLAKLGLKHNIKDMKLFYEELEDVLELVKNQLIQRFELIGSKDKDSYNYLFSKNYIMDSYKLEDKQKIKKVIKNGYLNIGLSGLGECVCALKNKEYLCVGDEKLIIEILEFINKEKERFSLDNKLNFIISETSDRNVLKKLIGIDKTVYGVKGLLNKETYDILYKLLDSKELIAKCQKYGSFKIYKHKKEKTKDFLNEMNKLNIIYAYGKDTT